MPRVRGPNVCRQRRVGWELRRDERGLAPNTVYAHSFEIADEAAIDRMLELTNCPVNEQTLLNLKAQSRAAGIGKTKKRRLNYIGRVEEKNNAWDRWRKHKEGGSGAKRLNCLVAEECLQPFLTHSPRVLANCKSTLEAMHLEALGAQLMFVGRGHGLNDAHAGPWRYLAGNNVLIVFLATLCARNWGDRPLVDARPTVSTLTTRPRRAAPHAAARRHDARRPSRPSRRGAPRFRRAASPRRASPPGRSRPTRSARPMAFWRRRRERSSRRSATDFGAWSPRSRRDLPTTSTSRA